MGLIILLTRRSYGGQLAAGATIDEQLAAGATIGRRILFNVTIILRTSESPHFDKLEKSR